MSVYIRELAHHLGMFGHQIDIYTRLNGTKHNHIIELYDNVRLIHLSAGSNGHVHKLALYYYLSDFLRALEGFKNQENLDYDLIHSHYWLSGRLGNWVQDRWNIPHIVMFHTLGTVKNSVGLAEREPDLRIATEKKLAQTSQRILAPTDKEKENLLKYFHTPAQKIGVVPCGVNLDLFRPMDKAAARQRLGLEKDEFILLYVGRFDPIKGIDRLLEAMAHLKHLKRMRLVIVGGDGPATPEYQNLRQLCGKFGIQKFVHFVGRVDQDQLPPYYSAADALVVPSYYESFGLVGLESLACGTPVVATRVGAMEDIIEDGKSGYVVADLTVRGLANGIEKVFSNPAGSMLSAQAIRASILKYGWPNVASEVVYEYDKVLRNSLTEPARTLSASCGSSV
jgi:D-inositol-3-phosphate glycosyltransferase